MERPSSGWVLLEKLDEGPPDLVTQISMWPKQASTASTNAATAAESVTSRALGNTSCPVDFSILAAPSSMVLAMRAHGDMRAFPRQFLRDGPSRSLAGRGGAPPAIDNARSDCPATQGWTGGRVADPDVFRHVGWPNPDLLMPVPPFGFGSMSKMMLSGRAGSPETPPTVGSEPEAAK